MLQGNAELSPRLNQQTLLQNWIEYQDYLLQNLEAIQQEGTETEAEHLKRLLQWTEREREAMDRLGRTTSRVPRTPLNCPSMSSWEPVGRHRRKKTPTHQLAKHVGSTASSPDAM